MTKHVLHYKSTFTDYKSYELLPINSQKSFYGKAIVTDYGDIKVLRSYGTPVVAMTPQGVFFKLWDGYSVTTQKLPKNTYLLLWGVLSAKENGIS